MSEGVDHFPDWVMEQRGRRYRAGADAGYLNRNKLIRRFARHLQAEGQPVSFDAIRSMLLFVDRGYSIKADQISRALGPLYRAKADPIDKAPNGRPVSIEGTVYPSARAAADVVGVSVQTVLRRVGTADGKWTNWRPAA